MERRASVRFPCHLVCQLGLESGPLPGTVLDVSKGGMRLVIDRPLDQGEAVRVRISPPSGKPIDVDTLVWHSRRVAGSRHAIGVVLSEPSTDYLEAVDAMARDAATGKRAPKTGRGAAPPEATFRLRAKRRDSPRTRTLHVDACSPEQARQRARDALGPEWLILETQRT